MIKKATMVLEGGATRGVFTSGVLDYLMEQEVYLSDVIGVSAGACNAVDYVSQQPGRTRDCMIMENDDNSYYYNIRDMVKYRSILNMDMVFDTYPNHLFPFDFDTYFASEMNCELVVTNCMSGGAEYLNEESDHDQLMRICRASSSMPLVSPIVRIDDKPYLDGGLADSVPIKRAEKLGNEKIVVILTRNPGYRKNKPSKSLLRLYRRSYGKYPNLVRTLFGRNLVYNRTMDYLEKIEKEGKVFVIRPTEPTVSRLERNADKLTAFYNHGYETMKEQYDKLMTYLDA